MDIFGIPFPSLHHFWGAWIIQEILQVMNYFCFGLKEIE